MEVKNIIMKSLWRRKGKALFLLLGIMVAISALTIFFTITRAMNEQVSNDFTKKGTNILILPKTENRTFTFGGITLASNVTFNSNQLPPNVVTKLKENWNELNLKVISPKKIVSQTINDHRVLLVGVDFKSELQMRPWLKLKGTIPEHNNEVLLGNKVSKLLNKKVGDYFLINDIKYYVSGIIEKTGDTEDEIILAPLPLINKFTRTTDFSLLEINIAETPAIEHNIKLLKSLIPDSEIFSSRELRESRKEVINKYKQFSILVSIVMWTIVLALIIITVINLINDRLMEIGLFRVLGFKKKNIIEIIVYEVTFICLTGGLLGFIGGVSFAKFISPFLGQSSLLIGWDIPLGMLLVFVSSFSGIVISWFLAARASEVNPLEAMSYL